MKILFLLNDGFGIGGTIRTTFTLAEALAARGHDVEVLSTLRRRDVPLMPLDPAVRLNAVTEGRPDHPDHVADPDTARPAVVYPKADYRASDYNLAVERRYEAILGGHDADAIIATRPGLIAYAAAYGRRGAVKVGQEHLTRQMHPKALRTAMARHHRRIDALVTVSQRDADDYRAHGFPGRVLFVPNSVPAPPLPPSDGQAKLIVTAGRLVRSKRFDLLLRAFAIVAAKHPDWRLRIYGGGDRNAELRALVVELGLHNRVQMPGRYAPIEPELAKGAIAVVSSEKEGFGMTLVEAMRCGLPVVSTDAPFGPREIVTDGEDGRLVPVGDHTALADGLLELIEDPRRRSAMAAAALTNAARFDPAAVAGSYERLLDELAARPARRLIRRLAGRLTRPRPPVAALPPSARTALPAGDCTVTAGGSVEVRVPPTALAGRDGWSLAWQAPRGAGSVPLPAAGAGAGAGAVAVTLPDDIAAGSYELHLVADDGARTPLLAGVRDTRRLMDRDPDPAHPVVTRLPFRNRAGNLGLRIWRREVLPEVGEVGVEDDHLTVEGRLYGTTLGEGAELELVCRDDPERTHRVPVRPVGTTGWLAAIPAAAPAAGHTPGQDVWDLALRPAAGAAPARLARFLDDVADKPLAYLHPAVDTGRHTVQPFFTPEGEFALRVTGPACGG